MKIEGNSIKLQIVFISGWSLLSFSEILQDKKDFVPLLTAIIKMLMLFFFAKLMKF